MKNITHAQQNQVLESIAKNIWLAYVNGNLSFLDSFIKDPIFSKQIIEGLEFFTNMNYANYRLEKCIDFPSCIKPQYFLHLVCWSQNFKTRYKSISDSLINLDLSLVVFETKKLQNIFNKDLLQQTIDKFELSFESENKYLENFQTLVFKLVKKRLGFNENLKSISDDYFSSSHPDNPNILNSMILNKVLSVELKNFSKNQRVKI